MFRGRITNRFLAFLLILILLFPESALASKTGTVNCSSLKLREKASTEAKVLQTLPKGTELIISSTNGDWYKVKYGKYTGFVMKKYVKTGSSSSSSSSKSSSSSSSSSLSQLKKIGKPKACEPGDSGSNVTKLQKCLQVLGYYTGSIDGDYGNGTKKAVKKLQKAKGLQQSGVADKNTIAAMFGEKVSSSDSSDKGTTERLDWFHGGEDKIPKHVTFTVKDCKTGKTFKAKRWSGANHIDAEPASKSDTQVIRSLYGGHWSWKRRPVLVKYNGHVYAASMNGMPHGTQTITNNGFDGHFCIHFYGSKTHGTKRVDATHQNCVSNAMHYKW